MKWMVSLWFPYLLTDHLIIQKPFLKDQAVVFVAAQRGRMVIRAMNATASAAGITLTMVLADARALHPFLHVFDFKDHQAGALLKELALDLIRYAPDVGIDEEEGLWIDASGCTHLWNGEKNYLNEVLKRLRKMGYQVCGAMAKTIGLAWAAARFGQSGRIISSSEQLTLLAQLPPAALRLEPAVLARLHKLGFQSIKDFMYMPQAVLRRRFGDTLLQRLGQAKGEFAEKMDPISPIHPYQERLTSVDPIRTRKGIEIALDQLLQQLSTRLYKEQQGLRSARFQIFRVDGKKQNIQIGTHRPSRNRKELFHLFNEKIAALAPGLGIECFVLEAPQVEPLATQQEELWSHEGAQIAQINHLLDRISNRFGKKVIQRFIPAGHHWPERSYVPAEGIDTSSSCDWPEKGPRPIYLLQPPERIQVSAPIPDYPPMVFTYKDQIHQVKKADGPERIEREWWIEDGLQRDYYQVENQHGARYWIFRSGHYTEQENPQWFMHGFFA